MTWGSLLTGRVLLVLLVLPTAAVQWLVPLVLLTLAGQHLQMMELQAVATSAVLLLAQQQALHHPGLLLLPAAPLLVPLL